MKVFIIYFFSHVTLYHKIFLMTVKILWCNFISNNSKIIYCINYLIVSPNLLHVCNLTIKKIVPCWKSLYRNYNLSLKIPLNRFWRWKYMVKGKNLFMIDTTAELFPKTVVIICISPSHNNVWELRVFTSLPTKNLSQDV